MSTASAQCPADDAMEPNDDCATAMPGTLGTVTGLVVTDASPDHWTYTIPAGQIMTVDVFFIHANADVDARLYDDSGTCLNQVGLGFSGSDNENFQFNNTTGAPLVVNLRIELYQFTAGTCNDYDLSVNVAPDPCLTAADDTLEPNDTCLTAGATPANPSAGLFVSQADEDFYSFTLNANEVINVNLGYIHANGDVDAELLASDCATSLDTGLGGIDNADVRYSNNTGGMTTVILRVFVDAASSTGSCNNYDLSYAVSIDPCLAALDDSFEENDDCASASPITPGTYNNLFLLKQNVDPDWYTITINDGATISVDAIFLQANGDVDLVLDDGCSGTQLDGSFTTSDNEDVQYTNNTGGPQDIAIEVYVWNFSAVDCNTYDLVIDVQGGAPTNLIAFCFGDGSGTPCPCGNNSTAGHAGGCANSAGDGAILVATGDPTVGADTLNLDLSSASPNSFALLVSGVNQLPQQGACVGCGNPAFDGLRCAGGLFLRHGSRATDGSGATGNGWGPPGGPAGGLIAANGFVAGQTRNFFAFYRENPAFVCQTGQNSSNGIQVIFN